MPRYVLEPSKALFMTLSAKEQLHGTIHTCIGQEFSGVAICRKLERDDFVTSNHRCHGHFIATTGQWRGLVDELVGNIDGVCAGIGSSQHLCDARFISNGQQGGLLPVAAGMALDRDSPAKRLLSFPSSARARSAKAFSTKRRTLPTCGIFPI